MAAVDGFPATTSTVILLSWRTIIFLSLYRFADAFHSLFRCVSNLRIYFSGSEYDTLQLILLSHLLPPVCIHLGRAISLEMIIALPRWFHYSMLCRCCTTLFGRIE